MTGRAIHRVAVKSKQYLSPNMLRIILGGDSLKNFPENYESGYVKLCFSQDSHAVYPVDALANFLEKKPRVRSYTIRSFDQKKCELVLDFVVHGDNGPSSAWAMSCCEGDEIIIDGPGAAKLIDSAADWFFLVGDMTALPAISVNLEKLPADAQGYAVIEVLNENDKIEIVAPKGMHIVWVVNANPDQKNTVLADKVKSLPWLSGEPSVWVASEFETMKNLRQFFKIEKAVNKAKLYISSYWKMGETDEGHKQAKKMDSESI